jgi:hypothetical protein
MVEFHFKFTGKQKEQVRGGIETFVSRTLIVIKLYGCVAARNV